MTATVAALYVQRGGIYWGRPDVDAWDEERDARGYDRRLPVVAHPPCARWCRLAKFVESQGGGAVGDDGGTFASATPLAFADVLLGLARNCGGGRVIGHSLQPCVTHGNGE